ncbi:MAG: 5'-methylthioadenosine/adenosylhomocysteine nucleosidase [Gammaproteobacteria bacterium]|nr:5'-methylthioadenosine/adenosylhomocysteine nucleosidase [Gammaproteobacteria bacterium]
MGALNEEIDLLRDDLKKPIIKTIAGRKYYSGTLYGRDTTMVFSGWGKVAAASTTTTLFNVFNVDMIIFTGVAGAANPTLNIGDIVLANKLYQHDMDARPIYDKYIIPLLDLIYFHSDKDLLNIAEIAAKRFLSEDLKTEISPKLLAKFFILNPKVAIGTIASGDQFVTDIKKVQALLIEQPTTKAIEMEGAAIAQVCHEYDKPFIVFRIISDKADHSAAINFQEFVKKIAAYYSRGFIKRLYPQISN